MTQSSLQTCAVLAQQKLGLGIRGVWASGFRVLGFGFWVLGFGFWVLEYHTLICFLVLGSYYSYLHLTRCILVFPGPTPK